MAEPGKDTETQSAEDLSVFVQNLLQQMQERFQQMSEAIITRIDEMGNRLDDLEQSVGDLMSQAGVDDTRAAQRQAGAPAGAGTGAHPTAAHADELEDGDA